jgi:hypothetical protein
VPDRASDSEDRSWWQLDLISVFRKTNERLTEVELEMEKRKKEINRLG